MQTTALSFQSGAMPTARTSITTTLSGSFNIYGLIEMCKIGSNASGTYETPMIDRGRWQIQLVFNDPQFVKLNFFAKQNPDELLDPTGNRKGTFEIIVSMTIGSSESNHTEGFRKYQPGQYVNAATGWSREYWLSKSVVFNKNVSSPVALNYTINERSEESWPSSPRTHSITSSTSSIHSIHSPHPTNPFLSTSPHYASPSPSLANPFVHNAFSSITASLFDDEETSNVMFIVSEPPPGTLPSEFYSKATKNAAGLSRNGSGVGPEDGVRGRGPNGGSGRNSRASRVRGAREEYIYAHTKVLSARSEYFRNMFANKSVFNEVLNVTSIEEDLGSMPMGPVGLGSELTDEDFDDGDEDITSTKPPPSGAITPSESSMRSSDGALTATTMKRRVVRVSDASYATYRATLYFLYTGLYSFTPLTPPERRTSRDLKDIKDNASVAESDVLSDFDPSELTFTQSQHNLNLNSLNASTSSISSVLSTGSVTSPPPNTNVLGASIQRRDSTARLQRGDSGSVTGHVLHHRDSGSQLRSQFTSTSTGTLTGPTNPPTHSTLPASSFGLSQSVNLGTRPGLHLRSFSSPNETEMRSVSPVVGFGTPTVSDDVPKSSAKSVYKLCHRLEIAELKAAALEHIRCSLTPENVVTEICSPFTARFPEVRNIEKEYLKANWANVRNTKSFGKLICKVFGDEPEGVGEMWLDFFREL